MVTPEEVFGGSSEMGALLRSLDWSQTSLGSLETWSQSLRTSISICLSSRFPILLWWGPDLLMFYNDAYRPMLGTKHPKSMGQQGRDCWVEIWDVIGPMLEGVLLTGEATWSENQLLLLDRHGYIEECYFTFSYSPIADETGGTGGVFTAVTETTRQVIGERRLQTLRDLAANSAKSKTVEEAYQAVIVALAENAGCIPFALLYRMEPNDQAHLVGITGLEAGTVASPDGVDLSQAQVWPFEQVQTTGQPQRIEHLRTRFGELFDKNGATIANEAIMLPLAQAGDKQRVVGFLILGISPKLAFDQDYQSFFALVTGNVETAIANVEAYEAERQRAEALAEIDRAKTTFFSNVSHEFRTPLTLMLSPLEELSNTLNGQLQPDQHEQLQLIQRNGLRLQKLVNTLLDFSRIEAGRIQAFYQSTDLATYTAELASVFRSLIEQAGMTFVIDCPALPEPLYVDHDMWEKIVLNLLSNAFKFTFTGSIAVRLKPVSGFVELSVTDTGVGIPESELPRLFERFHRVSGTRSRTYEGSGIGLALVQELVKLHRGTIGVTSQVDRGTTFTITIPFGAAHLPQDRIKATPTLASVPLEANPYVAEASRWLSETTIEESKFLDSELAIAIPTQSKPSTTPPARVLLVDDNADMRDYVKRLLSQYWEVETASDGLAALKAITRHPPDLVLSDVMMPGLDGFGLLHQLRSNPATQNIPVILLSARAGEEARIEGLEAGADDYLTKPFSARELLARVEVNLKLAQLRQAAAQQEQGLRLEVQAARDRLEGVLTRIADQFWALDRDWRCTYVNDRATEVSGIDRENLLGRNFWEIFPDVIGSQFEIEVRRAVAEQTPIQFEYFYPTWNRWFENHVYPSVDGVSIIATEITDRKRTEAQLRESEKFLQAINEAAPNLLYIFDLNERRNVYISPQIFPMLGILPVDVQAFDSQLLVELFHPDDLALIEQHHERIRAAQEDDIFTIEYRMKHASGKWLWLSSRDTIFVRNNQGKPIQILGSAIDISDRKQVEAEREQLLAREQAAREQAETANRIKDEFLAVLSHELRSPLNPILGWSRLLQNGKLDESQTKLALATIERNAKLQSELIEDLLDVSRILQGKLSLTVSPINLASTIQAAVETMRLATEAKSIVLETKLDPKIGQVLGDSTRLQQVLWNLLSNAVKFTPTGGQVTVQLEPVTDQAQITVRDTGKGIAVDFLPYVFDYFRQADSTITRQFGGLGLGLAIVRHLVELHGGTVRVESPGEGQGATFTVQLPLMLPSSRPDQDQPLTKSLLDLTDIQILVVDDEFDGRELLVFLLEQQGAQVMTATSASEALLLLTQSKPDVLISDIGMPGMDGYELIQQVRRLAPEQGGQIPAIALTAYAGELDQQKALAAGFQKHISKPVEPEQLIYVISRLIKV